MVSEIDVTAVLGYVVKDSKVLLMKRGTEPYQSFWSLPGGVINEGETPEQACIREVEEETGLNVHVIAEIARVGDTIQDTPVFLCSNSSGQLNCYPPESLAVFWTPLDRIHKLKLVPFIKDFLESEKHGRNK